MRFNYKYLLIIIIFIISGCASHERLLSSESLPPGNSGYIAGNFTLAANKASVTAFILQNVNTGEECNIPFTKKSEIEEGNNETVLLSLPAGTYKITHWIVYNIFWGSGPLGIELKAPMKEGKLSEPFSINQNEVLFIGKFAAHNTWNLGYRTQTTTGRFWAETITAKDAKGIFIKSYPNFSPIEFKCILCI